MSHGSEKRARTTHLTIRFTPDERATVDDHAARAGLTSGSYARQVLLGAPAPRQVRRPPVERQELVRILSQLGHVGSNVNQIARSANANMPMQRSALVAALDDLKRVRDAILAALGRGS
ncbi:MAG: plasmid mobilization relaxosome protein MobC [Phenylobacterium sp.]|uniref:plasmid mobilization protein n=1 Tax=Phenylobacterium sp. TaxID=1871053 RepID=UPI001A526960|nr:plasmid mobilization relaxosome protein MobC [Phenylobacterium sp.]MBL8554608.1 plasmid mobilization relaxosome protein MobC [Phenylobacterium sp.]